MTPTLSEVPNVVASRPRPDSEGGGLALHFWGNEQDGYTADATETIAGITYARGRCHVRPVGRKWQAWIDQPVRYEWFECGGWSVSRSTTVPRDVGTPHDTRETAAALGLAVAEGAIVEVRECRPEDWRIAA